LLDIGLTVMDGFELATRIRREFGINAPRMIAVTGYCLEQDRARSREIGFELHLVKPVDLKTLVAAIDARARPTWRVSGSSRRSTSHCARENGR
jgi:CheY-like chemotaxis protein